MEFEWDQEKAASNFQKHGLTFEAATAAFLDPHKLREPNTFVGTEERGQLIAVDSTRIIFVVYTDRASRTRLISARKANLDERERYWQNRLLHAKP